MRRSAPWLGLVVVPLLVGGAVFWYRQHSLPGRLAQARARVGTRAAGPLLERLARDYPGSAEVYFLRARQARIEERLEAASSDLDRAAALGWPGPQVERERLLWLARVDFSRARPALESRLDTAPDDRDVLLALAEGSFRLGQVDRTLELTSRVLRRTPDDGQTLCLRGRAWMRAYTRPRWQDQARADLEAALALDPEALHVPPARLALATCLLDQGEFERARALFRECTAESPGNPLAFFGLGRAASFLGHWDEAEEAFGAVLERRPGHVDSLLALAQVREQRGDLPGALDCLERAERGAPERAETHYRLAKLLRVLGREREAAAHEARYGEKLRWLRRQTGPAGTGGMAERDRPPPSRNLGEEAP